MANSAVRILVMTNTPTIRDGRGGEGLDRSVPWRDCVLCSWWACVWCGGKKKLILPSLSLSLLASSSHSCFPPLWVRGRAWEQKWGRRPPAAPPSVISGVPFFRRKLFCVSGPCGSRGESSSSGGRTSGPRTRGCSCNPCSGLFCVWNFGSFPYLYVYACAYWPVDVPVPEVPVGLVLNVSYGVRHDGASYWALPWILALHGDPLFHHGYL